MSGVASGKLRHWVEIQTKVVAQDPDTGEMLESWDTLSFVWAEIVPSSGREFLAAAAEQSEVRGRITIRYRPDVDAKCRLVYQGKWYGILAVMEDDFSMREHLTLMVAEGVRLDQ